MFCTMVFRVSSQNQPFHPNVNKRGQRRGQSSSWCCHAATAATATGAVRCHKMTEQGQRMIRDNIVSRLTSFGDVRGIV